MAHQNSKSTFLTPKKRNLKELTRTLPGSCSQGLTSQTDWTRGQKSLCLWRKKKQWRSKQGEIWIRGEACTEEAADSTGFVYSSAVLWILATFSPTLVIYGGKGSPCYVRILSSFWSLNKSESNQRLFVKAKLLQFYSSQWKARTLPMPPKRFPLHKDCPQKINNLVFSCWWQSQDRAGGGLFVFIFFQFFHPHLPHDPYILDSKNICFFPSIKRNHYPEINLSLWFKRQTQKQHQIAPEHLMGVISVLGLKQEVKRPIARFSLHRISQPGPCWH